MIFEILYATVVLIPFGWVVWAGWPRPPMAEWVDLPDPKGFLNNFHVPR